MEFGDRSTPHGLKWKDRDLETVVYRFPSGVEVTEREFDREILPHGRWIATAEGEPGHASFRFNALISDMPGANWDNIVKDWLDAKDQIRENPGPMKSFYNHNLGLPFEDFEAKKGVKSAHELQDLQVSYKAEIPPGVNFTTASVDVQSGDGGWFAVKVVGWGYNERAHVIGYYELRDHSLSTADAWLALEAFLKRGFLDEDGKTFYIQGASIDSGGHYTQEVYDFAEQHARRRWWAIKGRANAKGKRSDSIWPKEVSVTAKGKVYTVDVDIAKDTMFRRLHGDPAALNAVSFPLEKLPDAIQMDADYFVKLTRERKGYVAGGSGYSWSDPSDQEPWDTLIYNFVTLHGLRSLPGGETFKKLTGQDPEDVRRSAINRAKRGGNPRAGSEPEPAAKPARPAKPAPRRYGVRNF
jgi:phage terminase large subunit GpA-like protein